MLKTLSNLCNDVLRFVAGKAQQPRGSERAQAGHERHSPAPPRDAFTHKRERQRARVERWFSRWNAQRVGPPYLTGARLARVREQCDPRHLLCLPKYPNMFSEAAKLLRSVQRLREDNNSLELS